MNKHTVNIEVLRSMVIVELQIKEAFEELAHFLEEEKDGFVGSQKHILELLEKIIKHHEKNLYPR